MTSLISPAVRSTMFVFCMSIFKLLRRKFGNGKKQFFSTFHPLFGRCAQTQGSRRERDFLSGGTIGPSSCVLFGVLCLNYTRDFHAIVADEVVDHSQPADEKFSFAKRLAPEKEPDGVLNFLVLDPGEVSFLCSFVVLFEASDAFDNKPETGQNSEYGRV